LHKKQATANTGEKEKQKINLQRFHRTGTERNKRKIKLQKIQTPGTEKKNTREKILLVFLFLFFLLVVRFS
jgi:hypothetical protein